MFELLFQRILLGWYYHSYVDSLLLEGNERVLDYGSKTRYLADLITAKLKDGGAVVRRQDVLEQPLDEESFDVIVCHFAWRGVDDIDRFGIAKEWAKALVPGGRLFIREPIAGESAAYDVKRTLLQSGFAEMKTGIIQIPLMGKAYSGILVKDRRNYQRSQ